MPRNPRSTTYTTLMKVSLSTGLISYTARLTNPPPMAPPDGAGDEARAQADDGGHQEGVGSVKQWGVRLLPAQHRGEIRGEGHGDEHRRSPHETQEPHPPFVLQDVAGDLHFPSGVGHRSQDQHPVKRFPFPHYSVAPSSVLACSQMRVRDANVPARALGFRQYAFPLSSSRRILPSRRDFFLGPSCTLYSRSSMSTGFMR